MKPTIINKNSNFVVVTYWWGRGNLNKNTQRPCPEDLEEGEKLKTTPMTYDEMIKYWKYFCKKSKCNYMSVEYPEFAQKGMYQKAINFKPTFIELALDACFPRSVLYIDGDMHIRKYPHIFDIPNIDFASQGWNADPRTSMLDYDDPVCYYPYVFETSGGIMFYGNTHKARSLLKLWKAMVEKFPLKADDRLLSKTFNLNKMLVPMRYVPLPLEYLWLSDNYNEIDKRLSTRRNIFVEHPACLTGEERAESEGASSQRIPPKYDYEITNKVVCRGRGMKFWEYIYFPKKSYVSAFQQYLKVLDDRHLVELIPYHDKYGSKYNGVAKFNIKNSYKTKVDSSQDMVILNKYESGVVLAHLKKGVDVLIVPNRESHSIKKFIKDEYDFICSNKNTVEKHYKREYTLKIDKTKSMFFSSKNEVLVHLVTMTKNLSDLERVFNLSFIFISRISCKWI